MEKRRPMKQVDMTKKLILLIAVLAVILVAVICVAVDTAEPQVTQPGTTEATPGETTGTEPQQTVGTTAYVGLTVQALADLQTGPIEDKVSFSGTSDPHENVLVNGSAIARNADGSFLWR